MADEFGTPDAHDATSVSERAVIEAAQADVSLDKAVKESLLNRPLGSVKVSSQDRKTEFDLMKQAAELGDVEPFLTFFSDQNATEEQVIQYLKKMNK